MIARMWHRWARVVHKLQERDRLLVRNRPLTLVAGAGCEPATAGVMSHTARVSGLSDRPLSLSGVASWVQLRGVVLIGVSAVILAL